MAATYVDSSAIVKLVVREAESAALRRHLQQRRPFVSGPELPNVTPGAIETHAGDKAGPHRLAGVLGSLFLFADCSPNRAAQGK